MGRAERSGLGVGGNKSNEAKQPSCQVKVLHEPRYFKARLGAAAEGARVLGGSVGFTRIRIARPSG